VIKSKIHIQSGQLEDYLQESDESRNIHPDHGKIHGGLRLLVHKWHSKTPLKPAATIPLPFKDPKVLATVLAKLNIPKSYVFDFAQKWAIPLRLTISDQTLGKP